MERLQRDELIQLIKRVFAPKPHEKSVVFLLDLPDEVVADTELWAARRDMVRNWALTLRGAQQELGMETLLYHYRNAHRNNADLPEEAYLWDYTSQPDTVKALPKTASPVPFSKLFSAHRIFIAATHFSATAPLKLAARRYDLRGATMPGFTQEMIPALRLDYQEINRRVHLLKALLDDATSGHFLFTDGQREWRLTLDLRFHTGYASGGVLEKNGVAGNLPSGEAYMVPYEGERPGEKSRSNGILPVQFGEEIVEYKIVQNKAVEVLSQGEQSAIEAQKLRDEPAYGNLAELGLGVLADFGVKPCGEILLDEKLGLHIAFGRSDHFGGQVGAKQFSNPDKVIHIDRVYIKETMPKLLVKTGDLTMGDGRTVRLFRDSEYAIEF